MIRPIVKDILFLGRKAGKASSKDRADGQDLLDTLVSHRENCIGLAANITNHSPTSYDAEEGCLSLAGRRPCRRYDWVEVKYEDESFHKKKHRFKGFTAEIVQHEMDHLEGILI